MSLIEERVARLKAKLVNPSKCQSVSAYLSFKCPIIASHIQDICDMDVSIIELDYSDLVFLQEQFKELDIVEESNEQVEQSAQPQSSWFGYFWGSQPSRNPLDVRKDDLRLIKNSLYKCVALRILQTSANFPFDLTPDAKADLSPFSEMRLLEIEAFQESRFRDVRSVIHRLSHLVFSQTSSSELLAISPTLASAPQLQYLEVSNSPISSISEFSFPPSLRVLNLSNNSISTVIPDLSSLSQLRYLILDYNKMNHLSIPKLDQVMYLSIRKCGLENLLGVDQLPTLKVADFSDNLIWDVYEVGRLSDLPVKNVTVLGNPLTKLVTISVFSDGNLIS